MIGKSPISHSMQLMCNELSRKYQTRVLHVRADTAKEDEMRAVDEALDRLPPVAGVVNSAGVLDDKELYKIDRSSYQKVMGPKVNGASFVTLESFFASFKQINNDYNRLGIKLPTQWETFSNKTIVFTKKLSYAQNFALDLNQGWLVWSSPASLHFVSCCAYIPIEV